MKTYLKMASVTAGAATALVMSAGLSGIPVNQINDASTAASQPSSSAVQKLPGATPEGNAATHHATLTTCISGLDPC